jgi:DNA-binding NarL/FixJ family response regulator
MSSGMAVLIYSAFAGQELVLAAIVAGADGLLDKAASLEELFDAVRTVGRGGKARPATRRAETRACEFASN